MWEAVGPACEASKAICPEIKRLLETRSEELDKGEDISPTFSYGIWMLGRDPAHAVPTIILGCRSQPVRKRAKAIIKKSGVLHPGIAIKTTDSTPQPLVGAERASRSSSARSMGYGDASDYCGSIALLPFGPPSAAGATMRRRLQGSGLMADHPDGEDYCFPDRFSEDPGYLQFDSHDESDGGYSAEYTSKG